jgi:DNA-3-methyladenine glycosylase II
MKLSFATTRPFSFEQTLAFIRRFPGCQTQTAVGPDHVTAAFAADGRGWAVTIRDGSIELPPGAPRSLVRRAADWIGAGDDVARFYAAAAGDRAMQPIVRALHGLHHVRFLGLEDVAVHAVLMQRQAPARVAAMKRRFLEAFGHSAGELRAMPEVAELARIAPAAIGEAIRHPAKAERIAEVVRGVASLGEDFLRTAPDDQAKQALLAIPGVGPFSAAAILLRGLGRTDELPGLAMFEREGRAIYGAAWDEDAIARRYGDQIGYWSFYVKTGAARL